MCIVRPWAHIRSQWEIITKPRAAKDLHCTVYNIGKYFGAAILSSRFILRSLLAKGINHQAAFNVGGLACSISRYDWAIHSCMTPCSDKGLPKATRDVAR